MKFNQKQKKFLYQLALSFIFFSFISQITILAAELRLEDYRPSIDLDGNIQKDDFFIKVNILSPTKESLDTLKSKVELEKFVARVTLPKGHNPKSVIVLYSNPFYEKGSEIHKRVLKHFNFEEFYLEHLNTLSQSEGNHLKIIKTYQSGQIKKRDDVQYLIIEDIGEEDFFESLNIKHHNFKVSEFFIIFRNLFEQLAFFHKHQLLHDDLKPENIVIRLDESGNIISAQFCDFVSMKSGKKNEEGEIVFNKDFYSTTVPRSLSQDHFKEGKTITTKADVQALGFIMLQAISGNQRGEQIGVIEKILEKQATLFMDYRIGSDRIILRTLKEVFEAIVLHEEELIFFIKNILYKNEEFLKQIEKPDLTRDRSELADEKMGYFLAKSYLKQIVDFTNTDMEADISSVLDDINKDNQEIKKGLQEILTGVLKTDPKERISAQDAYELLCQLENSFCKR